MHAGEPADEGVPGSEAPRAGGSPDSWLPAAVRDLRTHLGLSQGAMARRIGTRQQTISEWETGARRPRTMSRRLLRLVAEESGFYRVDPEAAPDEDAPSAGSQP